MHFYDRRDAGRQLAERLLRFRPEDPVVFALPRGGVPVAAEVAHALDAPLDVLVVRKLGCPWQPELGMGAIGEDGIRLVNEEIVLRARVSPSELEEVARREEAELARRVERYRGDRSPLPVNDRTGILVDDGLATGFTARAGIEVLRRRGAARVILAAPVAPRETVEELSEEVDEVVVVETPEFFPAIGAFYSDFTQTTDEEVIALLAGEAPVSGRTPAAEPGDPRHIVEIAVEGASLPGLLTLPGSPAGIVVFAHGSGSSRLSPRNLAVAARLNEGGFGTLLFDLLTPAEELDRRNVFDIELLAERLVGATEWLGRRTEIEGLPIGYFGASTGAAAALWAAASLPEEISAVVSRGGRPDLAAPKLAEVRAPTLLIVGSRDETVVELNARAERLMRCASELAVLPGATHLFDEPGALERVAELALGWFTRYRGNVGRPPATEPTDPARRREGGASWVA